MVVPDAVADPRFAGNELVTGDPHIRFYAGAPLQTADGPNLGSLCVIDRKARAISPEAQEALEALSRQVVRLIELRHRNEVLGALVDRSPAAMFVKDSAARFLFVNSAWNEHFGRDDEEPVGKSVAEWFEGERGAEMFAHDVAVLGSRVPAETVETIPSRSGDRTWFTVRFPIAGIGGETMLGGVRFDLTRTLLAEQRWQESERRFTQVCVSAPDAIITGDLEGRVVSWNPAATLMFGYTEEEIVGKAWSLLIVPEDRERFEDPERWMRRTTREFDGVKRDGSRFPAEVAIARWRVEDREFRTCFVRDLTERRAIESKLEQARRVESLGHVAATVAHEFNNVLMAIAPFNMVISRVAGGDERVQRATGAIEGAIRRAESIVDQILNYARANEPKRAPVELTQWLEARREELSGIAGSGVAVRIDVPPFPVRASVDVLQLEQVLANLVSNARDAMQDDGTLRIRLEVRDYCAEAMLRDGERCARLTVSDTGPGMTEEILRKIFEPLFTTKRHGTGIGLSLARVLIEKHGGALTVTSEPGRGSDFVLHLPLLT